MKPEETEKVIAPCCKCGRATVLCPHCLGEDPYEMWGQYNGFMICQNEECEEYLYCCGC